MTSAASTLRRVIEALDDAGIPHMLVGSFASTAYSAPRATYDIDLVIDPSHESLDRFVEAFDPDTVYIGLRSTKRSTGWTSSTSSTRRRGGRST